MRITIDAALFSQAMQRLEALYQDTKMEEVRDVQETLADAALIGTHDDDMFVLPLTRTSVCCFGNDDEPA